MKFHIIGDDDTVTGYRFGGILGDVVDDSAQAKAAFARAKARSDVAVLLVTEPVSLWLADEVVAQRMSGKAPYVVLVGDMKGTAVKRPSLESLIYEAVGIKLVHEEEAE